MNSKVVISAVLALLLAAAALLSTTQPRAQGQQQKKEGPFEYKVVFSAKEYVETQGGEYGVKDPAKATTKQFNALAEEGWEYVGPVVEGYEGPYPLKTLVRGAYVVFKRSKK